MWFSKVPVNNINYYIEDKVISPEGEMFDGKPNHTLFSCTPILTNNKPLSTKGSGEEPTTHTTVIIKW